jgi:hypothetical protein
MEMDPIQFEELTHTYQSRFIQDNTRNPRGQHGALNGKAIGFPKDYDAELKLVIALGCFSQGTLLVMLGESKPLLK